MLSALLSTMGGTIPLEYLLLDGKFGHNAAVQMTRQMGLHLVSKLRNNAALYFIYDGPQKQCGPRRRYGAKIDYQAIPDKYRKATYQTEKILRCNSVHHVKDFFRFFEASGSEQQASFRI